MKAIGGDKSYTIRRARSAFGRQFREDGSSFALGCVFTPRGIVEIFAESGRGGHVRLRFVRNGVEYWRRFKGAWTQAGIARAAHSLARRYAP
jgi:hypothetical protein